MQEYSRAAHQIATKDYCIKHPYVIVALEMGLGKSVCLLDIAHNYPTSKTLIVCPAYLRLNWEDEINKFYPYCKYGKTYDVFKSKEDIYKVWDTNFIIISYELLEHAESLFEWANIVAFDEATYLKTMEAKRTEFAHKWIYENNIRRCYLLTGTPIKNRVWEFFSLITMCQYDPRIEESAFMKKFDNYITFADYFSFRETRVIQTPRGAKEQIVWNGLQREDELKQYLKGHYIRYRSRDVLDLPKAIDKNILISEENNIDLLEAFEMWSGDPDNNSVNPRVKAMAALKKVPFTVKYAQELMESGVEQLVIFTDHVESCKAIARALGVTPITGTVSSKKRHSLNLRFQAGIDKIIVATIGSFSTGVNLTAAHHMIFNDYCWVPGDLDQAIFRIVRTGQKNRCIFHYILGSYQDKRILEVIQEKRYVIDRAVDFQEKT